MKNRLPRVLRAIGLVALLVPGVYLLFGLLSWNHKIYEVEGTIRISPAGPNDTQFPAVACMWATSYGLATPGAVTGGNDYDDHKAAYVICHLPEHPISIPFGTAMYSNTGHGLLIGAFLRSLPGGHTSCADPGTVTALVSDPDRALSAVCSAGELPAESETALMAPFDDDEGRPTDSIKIVIGRAE